LQSLDIEWEGYDTEHFLTKNGCQKFFEGKTIDHGIFLPAICVEFDIMIEVMEPEGGKMELRSEQSQ
jgi:deoxyribodipyrimidine photolyase-related protein